MKKLINPSMEINNSHIYLYEWNKVTCGICVTPSGTWLYPDLSSGMVASIYECYRKC